MKTIIAAAALALISSTALAGGKDPSPEAVDPVGSKEEVLGSCLTTKAGFTHVPTVQEYEAIRYKKPNHFYFGSRIWLSKGTDLAKAKPCLDEVGAE